MAKSSDTMRDPVREVFGTQPLRDLTAAALREGLDKLNALSTAASASIAAIKQQTKADIIAGKANASAAILNPGDAMDQAKRWQLALQTAIEAATEAAETAERREQDATLITRRTKLTETLNAHQAAAETVDRLVAQLAIALTRMDSLGLQAVRASGVRLSGTTGGLFRADHSQHLVNLGLHARSDGLWMYDRVPQTRGYIPVSRECAAMGMDALAEFEERIEHQIGRPVDWDPVPETAGADA